MTNGHGRYISAEGDYYVGEWFDGFKHGKGVYVWAVGDKYDGEYKLD